MKIPTNKILIAIFVLFMSFSLGAVWMSGIWSQHIVAEGIAEIGPGGKIVWLDCGGRALLR